ASTSHLAMEFFKPMAGITPTHVPYKTAVSALTDLSSGRVDVMFENLGTAAPYLVSKRVRALAFGGAVRSKVAPDVPTFAESGFPEYNVYSWNGIYAPPGTPKAIIDRLNHAFVVASQSAEVRQRVADSFSANIKVGTPQQFEELVRSETSRISKAIASKTLVLE
ncbi:MAG: tripartite tricarboxylate transporter substrate-binding protein, partial [Burkholderiaceae bacterium]|nr:tripartite tricarboxylate transporter substrate-binding protein [Burkholderiaceae bacterium]